MSREKRREVRIAGDLECAVSLREVESGRMLAGPISGRIKNISSKGMGIALGVIRIENLHFFYSVLDTATLDICVETPWPGQPEETMAFRLRPVWFDRDLASSEWPFVMGLEIISGNEDKQVEELMRNLASQRNPDSWLRNSVDRLRKLFV